MQGKYGIKMDKTDGSSYLLYPDGQLYVLNGYKYTPYYQPITMNNVSYIMPYNATQQINHHDDQITQEMKRIIDMNFESLTTQSSTFNWETFATICITPYGYIDPKQQQPNQYPGFTDGGYPGEENYTPGDFNYAGVGGDNDENLLHSQHHSHYHLSFGSDPTYGKYLDALINASLPILLSLVAPKAIYAAAERFGYEVIANSPLTGVCAFALAGIATYKLQNRYLHSIEARSACEAMVRKMIFLTAEEYKPEIAYIQMQEDENKEARRLQLMTWVPAVSVGLCYTASAYLAFSWMYNQPELELPSAVVTILIGSTGLLAGLLTSMRAEAIATEQYL